MLITYDVYVQRSVTVKSSQACSAICIQRLVNATERFDGHNGRQLEFRRIPTYS